MAGNPGLEKSVYTRARALGAMGVGRLERRERETRTVAALLLSVWLKAQARSSKAPFLSLQTLSAKAQFLILGHGRQLLPCSQQPNPHLKRYNWA